MNMSVRWIVAIILSLISFGACWWGLQHYAHLDSGVAVGVAAVPFTITLTLGGVWADRARKKEQSPTSGSSSVSAPQATGSQISGDTTGANFGPGGDFRNSSIFIGPHDTRADFPPYEEKGKTQSRITSSQMVFGDIPQRPQSFEERPELQENFTNTSSGQGAIWVVIGPRGVGKSQLAGAIARKRLTEGWRVVAWVNAENIDQLTAELGQLAIELGLSSNFSDATKNAMRVRHWLEVDGDRCLLVFDNAINPDVIRRFLPAAGAANVIITSFRRTLASLGTPLMVDVFTAAQAVDFLTKRTGRRDEIGARNVAADLGYLPLALAQAAAVIAGQNIDYEKYRDRLASTRIADYLSQIEGDPYSLGVAEAIMLSISFAETRDSGQVCRQILELISVLSPSGTSREFIYSAAQLENSSAFVVPREDLEPITLFPESNYTPIGSPAAVDAALQVLSDSALTTWNIDNQSVSVHRLVARVVRERADHDRTLGDAAQRAIGTLYSMWGFLEDKKPRFGLIGNEEAMTHIAALENSSFEDEIDSKHQISLIMMAAYKLGYEHATRHRAALKLADMGQLDEAIALLERLVEEIGPIEEKENKGTEKKGRLDPKKDLEMLRRRRLEQQ
jgi:hypothetical protein